MELVAKRWVRYVVPVMVEVDVDDDDKVTRVVSLPVREDRDDMGHFLIYDEEFIRRSGDDQPQVPSSAWGNLGGQTTGSASAARRTGRSAGRRASARMSPTIGTRRSTRTSYARGRTPLGPVLPELL
ncbi:MULTISPECIES: hypothetical protein [unclassified Streptomyces]|uniref:hypothetical protein n=1 Tax=unclassified Streptomyces TaxID=2593676 RepID=UPI002254F813|nr:MULTISPECIES: hypothetical protein [unclassified Streptomyces]WSP53084.1 hypothetical protein OG306_00445 [Streptomyces sp. NBC_01241]WSU26198.1 hypothetical protein OG508_38570 [Streptomyces sp. NBC_01108]MCX4799411.1 hypothetical protein [Streptomyces sp. NBC_01242]WSJ40720.1 hypothetical protein OG772_35535 [Streptomyces sp. NBC_01321]WSP67078.1 hypothetical protein OG466_38530 [Streptomyces sp. NBC_01240]